MQTLKKKLFALSTATVAAGLSLTVGMAGAATAANLPNPPSYGFDGNAHLIVGGGSITVYKIGAGFASLYDESTSCVTNNSVYDPAGAAPVAYPQSTTSPLAGAFNQCDPTSQPYTGVNAGGNYNGDTVVVASPTGSSTGIASLNGAHSGTAGTFAYEGTNASIPTSGDPNVQNGLSNGFGTVDFALSSRAAKTSGGNCPLANPTSGLAGDELQCDTFWGVAADGVEVFTWGSTVAANADNTNVGTLTAGLTGQDLANIWTCVYTTWGQLPEYAAAVAAGLSVPPSNAPIVPWSMNSGSGTYADFNNYVAANSTDATFTADVNAAEYTGAGTNPQPPAGKCAREVVGAQPNPPENDVKPPLEDVQANQGGLSQNPLDTNNPANWIWFGSYGLLSAYSYLSQPSLFGNQYSTFSAPINGQLPSTADIGNGTYAIPRVLSIVTKKADADCPLNAGGTACQLTLGPTNGNGTVDLNINGGTTGKSGAVREFVRFLCRTKAESFSGTTPTPADPYTGISDYTDVGSVISGSGFTLIPTAQRSPGSNCAVTSVG